MANPGKWIEEIIVEPAELPIPARPEPIEQPEQFPLRGSEHERTSRRMESI